MHATATIEETVVSQERATANMGGIKQGSDMAIKIRNISDVVRGCSTEVAVITLARYPVGKS